MGIITNLPSLQMIISVPKGRKSPHATSQSFKTTKMTNNFTTQCTDQVDIYKKVLNLPPNKCKTTCFLIQVHIEEFELSFSKF